MKPDDIINGQWPRSLLSAWRKVLRTWDESDDCEGKVALARCVKQLKEALDQAKIPGFATDLFVSGYETGAAWERDRAIKILHAIVDLAEKRNIPNEELHGLDIAIEILREAKPTTIARDQAA
jgi:hypothetical protein